MIILETLLTKFGMNNLCNRRDVGIVSEANNDQVEALNKVLKGEHMAIDVYSIFLDKIDDTNLKESLQRYKKDHEEHAALLSKRIRELGGEPKEDRGVGGAMSQSMSAAQTMIVADKKDIIKELYNGEDKGIAATENVIRDELDDENKKLVSEIISTDHEHLKGLQSLLER
jgi:bacterioferritin